MQTEIIFSDFSFCFPRNPEERLRKSKVEPLWFPEQKSRLISFPPIFQLCFLPPKEPVLKWSWIQAGRHNFSVPPLISYLNCLTAVPPPDTCGNYFYEPADFVKKDRLPTDSWKKAFLCKEKNFFDLFLWKTPEIKTPPVLISGAEARRIISPLTGEVSPRKYSHSLMKRSVMFSAHPLFIKAFPPNCFPPAPNADRKYFPVSGLHIYFIESAIK